MTENNHSNIVLRKTSQLLPELELKAEVQYETVPASVAIATIPIIIVYPWLQKYFVKGMMLGSVKG